MPAHPRRADPTRMSFVERRPFGRRRSAKKNTKKRSRRVMDFRAGSSLERGQRMTNRFSTTARTATVAAVLLVLAAPVFARGGGGMGGGGMGGGGGGEGWHGGGGGHGHGFYGPGFRGRGFGFGFYGYPFWGYGYPFWGFPFWGYWGYPYYGDYGYAPPYYAYAAGPPPTQSFWYFCPSSNAYYPYVTSCGDHWEAVPATPPATQGPIPGSYNAQ